MTDDRKPDRQRVMRRIDAFLAVDLVIVLVVGGIIVPRWETLATWQVVLAWCAMAAAAVWLGWSWGWTILKTWSWWRR